MNNSHQQFFHVVPVLLCLAACSIATNKEKSWTTFIDNTGTYSSPRLVDLNNDAVPDVIIGAGGQEEKHSDTAIVALDGFSGKILWTLPGENQNVGSAVFSDVTGDRVPDVFIGGRWAQLQAIDGSNGKVLWSFYKERKKTDGSDGGWYNFTSPQLIPDQDKDGKEDLLIANGGDAHAAAGDLNRPAGRILIISAATGNIISNCTVPDGKETYMSPVIYQQGDSAIVIFGTGGETIGGSLYRTTLNNILQGDISNARIIKTTSAKGFVSSPVIADINADQVKDIIVNSSEGHMIAFNGVDDSVIWQINWPGTEAYTMPCVGYFNNDSTPDFYGNFAIGVFPVLNRSIRFMVDGKNGKVLFSDTIPSFQYASAIAADINEDGSDEVIVSQSALKRRQFDNVYFSFLTAFDFKNNQQISMSDTLPGTNLASTPWIGDMDNDRYFDIVYASVKYENAQFDLMKPLGIWVRRVATKVKITKEPRWGAFMGTDGKSVY